MIIKDVITKLIRKLFNHKTSENYKNSVNDVKIDNINIDKIEIHINKH